ncbi:MAG: D-alanyl-D-alanine carboxypeptidase family protein [Butyribacter sp.]|nr:D-alanyl-D-alanine carboxypeptidase family protein [bacterium]MDY3854539.1 D-alanyl-D-alanine carboxypeptidase family protein [Butyribacter sp.]
MKRKIAILGGCVILFAGVLSTQMGHFKAGLDSKPTGTPAKEYEYYYNENEEDSENTDMAEGEITPATETPAAQLIDVNTKPDSYSVLVNREYPISKDYIPADLVVPNVPFSFYGIYEKSYVRQRAATALEDLFGAAKESGYTLKLVSAYRSYDRQKQIYNNNVSKRGVKKTDKVSAMPGTSEHQTGLAIDVSCSAVGCTIEESFGNTDEGKWLKKNCYKYGFIIRYPKNKTDITGYSYEPWHIRYVGKNLAKHLVKNKITLEEYYQLTTLDEAVQEEVVQDTDTSMANEPQMTAAPTPKATIKPTAKPTPKASKKPKKTAKPKATPKSSKKPEKTAKPAKTPKPVKTPKPTQKPVVTKHPAATQAPVVTKPPEDSETSSDSGSDAENQE